jgi:hypothetical protein
MASRTTRRQSKRSRQSPTTPALAAPGDWEARLVSGPIVAAHLAGTADDDTRLTRLPPAERFALASALADAAMPEMCSVDSTVTCRSTTWCHTTTACPSTTDCKSVQTCAGPTRAGVARDVAPAAARPWPLPVA